MCPLWFLAFSAVLSSLFPLLFLSEVEVNLISLVREKNRLPFRDVSLECLLYVKQWTHSEDLRDKINLIYFLN